MARPPVPVGTWGAGTIEKIRDGSYRAAAQTEAGFDLPGLDAWLLVELTLVATLPLALRRSPLAVVAAASAAMLAGEGLQHTDGSSHLTALEVPGCRAYDPAFAYETAVVVRDGLSGCGVTTAAACPRHRARAGLTFPRAETGHGPCRRHARSGHRAGRGGAAAATATPIVTSRVTTDVMFPQVRGGIPPLADCRADRI